MAKRKLFAPFDSKLNVWMDPMVYTHAGMAERHWEEIVNDGKTLVSKHPADYGLYQVGEFDDESGQLQPIFPPVLLMSAVAAKKKPEAVLPLGSGK